MTFVDAAIVVLRDSAKPMSIEELTELVVERGLLDSPGANPLRSMKGRITAELKRGDESRVVKVEEGIVALRDGDAEVAGAEPVAAEPEAAAADEQADEADGADDADDADELELSPEEREFAEVYGDEGAATAPVAEIAEYRDSQTDDEDREMLPEIVAERRGRPGRERGRRRRRERGGRRDRGERDRGREAQDAAPRERDAGERELDTARDTDLEVAGGPLGLVEDAASVLRSMGSQAVPIRQLAQMMRKRRMVDEEPDQALPRLRAALRYDERWSTRRGVRPLVVHVGRDCYQLANPKLVDGELAAAERRFRAAVLGLEAQTKARLSEVLRRFELPALERLSQIFLEQTGFTNLKWIKRAGKSGYALADGPNGPTLIGVRVGPDEVDRRGIGELRVGVQAKSLPSGLLLSPVPLSADALAEWDKGGKPVAVMCGPSFVDALVGCGVGVRWLAASVPYLDEEVLKAVD